MAEKNKKSFQIKTNYYLCGPLALCAFFLMDVIGGFNFPGYDWSAQVTGDLVALNSNSFVISLIFAIIYALLTIFSVYCLYKFFKNSKLNKLINRGLKIALAGVVIFALGFCIFLQTDYGTYDKVKENAQIATTEETIEPDAEDESAVAETQTVYDEETTMQNLESLSEVLSENPTVIGGLATSVIANILVVLGLVFMLIGGFKKGGKTLFAAIAVFCLVLVVYSLIAVSVMAPDIIGINSRFSNYAFAFFVAFMSAYVYVTNVEE